MIRKTKLKKGSIHLPEKIWEYIENKATENCVSVASMFREYVMTAIIQDGLTKQEILSMIYDDKGAL